MAGKTKIEYHEDRAQREVFTTYEAGSAAKASLAARRKGDDLRIRLRKSSTGFHVAVKLPREVAVLDVES